ncbi:hypothetical protein AVEN_74870-1, partial [Araneus ventricosus]
TPGVTPLGQANNAPFHVYNAVSASQIGLPSSISSISVSGQRTVTSIALNVPPRYTTPVDSNLGNIGTIMYYDFHNKLGTTLCHHKICESLGINTVSYDTVKVWFQKFIAGNFNIEDEPCSGRSIEVDCEQLKEIIDQDGNV